MSAASIISSHFVLSSLTGLRVSLSHYLTSEPEAFACIWNSRKGNLSECSFLDTEVLVQSPVSLTFLQISRSTLLWGRPFCHLALN